MRLEDSQQEPSTSPEDEVIYFLVSKVTSIFQGRLFKIVCDLYTSKGDNANAPVRSSSRVPQMFCENHSSGRLPTNFAAQMCDLSRKDPEIIFV